MSIFSRIFFKSYNLLWRIAMLFLCRNKRLKDGWSERLIPKNWLEQELVRSEKGLHEKNPNKTFFCYEEDRLALSTQSIHGLFHRNQNEDAKGVDLWLQAASGGEAFLAIDFLRAMEKTQRGLHILITTWTRQGYDILERECAQIISEWQKDYELDTAKTEHQKEQYTKKSPSSHKTTQQRHPLIQIRFAALDKNSIVSNAFSLAKPKCCVMFETELWPNFMRICKEKNIPLYVINARMTSASFEYYKIIKPILKQMAPKKVLATTHLDVTRFSKIFPSSQCSYMANMKFDRAYELVKKQNTNLFPQNIPYNLLLDPKHRFEKQEVLQHPPILAEVSMQKEQEQLLLEEKPYLKLLPQVFSKAKQVILFASVRQEEESLLTSILWSIFSKKKQSIFIIAPRHMHRAKDWFSRLHDLGMRPLLASTYFKSKKIHPINHIAEGLSMESHQCIIWDMFGDLPYLYSQADFAFVGGSYKHLGGQNFLEALACGAVTHVGPHLDNFLWALGKENPPSLFDKKLLISCNRKRDLHKALLKSEERRLYAKERLEIQNTFSTWIEKYKGSSAYAVNQIFTDNTFDVQKQAIME